MSDTLIVDKPSNHGVFEGLFINVISHAVGQNGWIYRK